MPEMICPEGEARFWVALDRSAEHPETVDVPAELVGPLTDQGWTPAVAEKPKPVKATAPDTTDAATPADSKGDA